jgi:hypothetical protein
MDQVMLREPPRDYFTSIPHLVDDAKLSPYAYRLYGHLRRVAGETVDGRCWQSTETLAEHCDMSTGSVSKAKKDLEAAGLIAITSKTKNGTRYHEISILDVWQDNHDKYARSPGESALGATRSLGEGARSPGETKKNPRKKNQEKKNPYFAQKREKCPKCGKAYSTGDGAKQTKDVCTCSQQAKMAEYFGPGTSREPITSDGDWTDLGKQPWMLADYGRVRPRNGITVASLRRVRWLIEQHTSLRPVDKQLKGWWAACGDIYQSGRGDWNVIEKGIKAGWARDPKYRPRHPNGFVGEVQVAFSPEAGTRRKYLIERDGQPVFEIHEADGAVSYEPYQ